MLILHTRQGSRLRTERDYGTADFVAEYIKLGVIPYVARKKEDRLGDRESNDMAYQLFDPAEGVQAKQGTSGRLKTAGGFAQ